MKYSNRYILRSLCLIALFLFPVIVLTSCATDRIVETEILWDTWGVPHIYADSWEGLFQAFGWSQMHNHGDLILKLYGEGRGRAAEYWGERYRNSDSYIRKMGVPRRSEEWLAKQSPHIRSYLDAFTDGMNRYAEENPDLIDEEVKVVLPVVPSDVLAHIQRVIHLGFVGEQTLSTLNKVGEVGSNAWAVAQDRSTSKNALLLANPHLPWSNFFTLYEAHLIAPDLNAYGVTLVGMPVLAIAFNDYLGWTHTANTMDGADLYEVFLQGEGYNWPPVGLGPDYIREFNLRHETVKIKNADGTMTDEKMTIRSTDHGPVVEEREGSVLVSRIVGLDQPHFIEQYWDMMRATNIDEFEDSLKRLQNPAFNVVYADRAGHIMYLFGGRQPVRKAVEEEPVWSYSQGILPGNHPINLWTETHRYTQLPRLLDPESGWIQNANDPPWTSTFPMELDPEDYPPYMAPRGGMSFRAQRSVEMLQENESISLEEMINYKHSTRMHLADRILEDLISAARRRGGIAAQAANLLNSWDREANADSRGAVLFEAWTREIGIGPDTFEIPWDEERPRSTPTGLSNLPDAVMSLEVAAKKIQETYGALDVPWGDVFRLQYGGKDLPANGGSDVLGVFRSLEFDSEGDTYRAISGDSYVAAIEFSDPVRAKVLLSYGNASQLNSPHRGDQLELFANKELRNAWRTREEIEENLESVQKLEFRIPRQ